MQDEYWPGSLVHLQSLYDDESSDYVTIAELDYDELHGNRGFRRLFMALIPHDIVEDIVKAPGGIGFEVKSWGPNPVVATGATFKTSFWVSGRSTHPDERFETIINCWLNHNQDVLLVDNVFLMTYGLIPRFLANGVVCWDDPQTPVYEVVQLDPHMDHSNRSVPRRASIKIRRDYLEDYCHLKSCAAVAVFYEERFSKGDESFDAALKSQQYLQLDLPGRRLELKHFSENHYAHAPQMSSVWGLRHILTPKSQPISDPHEPELIWPDDNDPMTLARAGRTWSYGYVRDIVLRDYEGHPEFSIYPESGDVAYGNWWSTNRNIRIGRNHIRVELKSLYEGCRPHILEHWHRFAVPKADADRDAAAHGCRSIAVRAKEVLESYLKLTEHLVTLSQCLNFSYSQEDITKLDSIHLRNNGWWTAEIMRPLYSVAPLDSTEDAFLDRAESLAKLLELLQESPLRNLLLRIGLTKESIREFKSLKLLAVLCQLTDLAIDQGHSLTEIAAANHQYLKELNEIVAVSSLFALQTLRINKAHASSPDLLNRRVDAYRTLEIDPQSMKNGWGYATDGLYDRLSKDLESIGLIVKNAMLIA